MVDTTAEPRTCVRTTRSAVTCWWDQRKFRGRPQCAGRSRRPRLGRPRCTGPCEHRPRGGSCRRGEPHSKYMRPVGRLAGNPVSRTGRLGCRRLGAAPSNDSARQPNPQFDGLNWYNRPNTSDSAMSSRPGFRLWTNPIAFRGRRIDCDKHPRLYSLRSYFTASDCTMQWSLAL